MNFIDMLKVAGTLRVMVIALIAWAADHFGLAELVPHGAEATLDTVLQWATAGFLGLGILWRIIRPQPSLTQAAAAKAREIGASAKEVVPAAVLKQNIKVAKAQARSPALVGLIALVIALATLLGCTGTRAAYKAAANAPKDEVLERLAQVTAEHYDSLVMQADDMAARGLPASILEPLQSLDRRASPIMVRVTQAGEAYQGLRNAANAQELDAALKDAARVLSDFADAIKKARSQAAQPVGRAQPVAPLLPALTLEASPS